LRLEPGNIGILLPTRWKPDRVADEFGIGIGEEVVD